MSDASYRKLLVRLREKIRILEQKTVGGVAWGRTDRGWVCMQYSRNFLTCQAKTDRC